MAAHTARVVFEDILPPVSEWQFLDVETDIKGFKLGVLNDQIFQSASDLVAEVLKRRDSGQKVVCSYNGFKFDWRLLGQLGLLPSVKFGSYTIHHFPGMLNVDLWYWARNYFTTAESKSLRDLAAQEGYPIDWSKLENYDEVRASEDNKMARFLSEKIDVREAWKILINLTNCCPLILQNFFVDRTDKAILHSWYLSHGYLPVDYPDHGSSIVRGPVRSAVPGLYENMAMIDVKSAYLRRAASRELRIYDKEEPAAFTDIMREFLELIRIHPRQKPTMKYLAVTLVGNMASDDNFFRRENIYSEIVEGFADEFGEYLSNLPKNPAFVHTDGALVPADLNPPPFNGYELTVKDRYIWVAVYDKQRTLGLLAEEKPRIKARGFLTYSSSYPLIFRWVRDRFYHELSSTTGIDEVRRILQSPQSFLRRLEVQNRFRLPEDTVYWETNVWKESEMFPARWDHKSPLWNDWSDLKPGPNRYPWDRRWVLSKIDDMLRQYELPLEVLATTNKTRRRSGA